jgi:membrane dipeptidase
MDDEMIKRLAHGGGVIQINFGSMFLTDEYRNASRKIEEFLDERGVEWDSPEATNLIAELREKNPPPDVTVMDVAEHIDHVVRLVGIEYVGLGSDFDGVGGELPSGLEDVSCYPNLIRELLTKGYSKEDIEKICSANFLRVWSEIDRIARQLN